MNRHPQAVVVVDPNKEKNAIIEARKLGITTVALIDTDCDPDKVDLPIPGNDDSIRSIELIIGHLVDAVNAGRQEAAPDVDEEAADKAGNGESSDTGENTNGSSDSTKVAAV